MLEFLQTGKALSVLAAIGIIGIVSKLITRSLYKRLLKETDNMAMTKNKNLKVLKQKLENAYRLNQNIVNTQAYLDKHLYGFRFMHVSLDSWNNLSLQMTILSLLAEGRLCLAIALQAGEIGDGRLQLEQEGVQDSYYIVLYASIGALSGLFLTFMDSSFNITQKQQKLETVLLEYVDNSVFVRAARENSTRETAGQARAVAGIAGRERLSRENEIKDGLVREEEPRQLSPRNIRNRNSKAEELLRTVRNMKEDDMRPDEEEGSAVDKTAASRADTLPLRGRNRDGDNTVRRDIDYLKHSLDQIAASKEKGRDDKDWMKNLNGDEMKIIGEIMRQYFTGS